ncbi:MAG TPA: hypothetical protein VGR91_10885 [Stellaceae bacterium]|nr:hypothetical protein [Stellaceae bacterium]
MLGLAGAALAQSPKVPAQLGSNPKYQQLLYFYRQRAYPHDRIPAGAYQRARRDFIRKWGAAPGALGNKPSAAQPGLPVPTGQWTSIGPTPITNGQTIPAAAVSGRVNAIAVNPSNPSVVYIGAADGGVWESTDGGTDWTPLTDGQCSMAMGALAIDPVNTNIVYAGTGEQNFSLDSDYGCGVLRSADGGQTWTQLGASTFVTPSGGATISRLLIDPTTAGSTTATTLLVTADSGVYRSTDSGASWSNVLSGTATDAVRNPSAPATVYAALGNIFGDPSNGVYKSADGGQTWTQLGGGLPTSNVGRINLAIAASAPATLYAAVQDTSNFGDLLGIWKSINGGTSWTQLSASGATCNEGFGGQCWYDMHIEVDPTNANAVYFGGEDLFRSTDGGSTFTDLGGYNSTQNGDGIHPDQHILTFDPGNASVLYIGNDGGVFKSPDGGSTWSSLNQNLTLTQFGPGLSATPDSAKVLGGTQDNGTDLYTGSIGWTQVQGGDGGFTAIDFNTPTTFYQEFTRVSPQVSFDGGASWNDISAGISANSSLFYTPFVMSPSSSHTLYLGTNFLNRTTNQGSSWSALTQTPDASNISAIAEAKSNPQIIYYGTDSAAIEVSTNGGGSWTPINSGLPNLFVTHIAVNPTNPENAFVTFQGFGSGHVWETTNGGTGWANVSGNLPDIGVNVILLDPNAPTTNLLVGTDLGVFRTTDGGASWSPYQDGLPNVVVEDLVFNSTTGALFAATHGRGVWESTGTSSFTLSVSETGSGMVTSAPPGISCPSTCSASFAGGTAVTLTPTPANGWSFAGWGGACSGTGGCTVTMNAAESVSATFTQNFFPLTVAVTGSGTITSSPTAFDCGGTCEASFAAGTQVTLIPTAANGWSFAGWGGACSGTGSCSVTMNAAASVSASFTPVMFPLTVGVTGGGTITSSPPAFDCGSTCEASFAAGTQVTLIATPAIGWSFAGWGGACSGTGGCSVTMNAAVSVSASFTHRVTLTVAKTGRGKVTSSPNGIACGRICNAIFKTGTQVTLHHTAAAGWHFVRWGGACKGRTRCRVNLEAATSVTALFQR